MLRRTMIAGSAAFALAACQFAEPAFEDPPDPETLLPAKVAVQRIETLELGRLADGYVLTAFGVAPGGGYYQPELRVRYEGATAADGFYEFDFLVRPPDAPEAYAAAPEAARRVRADIALTIAELRAARGVRVWSATDGNRMTAVLSALTQVGVGYRHASSVPGKAFDCSGLVGWAWEQAGVALPHQSRGMINAITRKDLSAVLPGDVFHYPGHVSMALGVGDAIVHAVGRGQLVQVRAHTSDRITVGTPV